MPFDEEEDNDQPSAHAQKIGLKQVSTQKSIFDSMPKKQTPEEFTQKIKGQQDRGSSYKIKAADLAQQFSKMMSDKTLKQNKTIFQHEIEKELVVKMINLGIEINNDPGQEKDGMGSMAWIVLLFNTCLAQRDKLNVCEYALTQVDKKIELVVSKEIQRVLDSKKTGE